MEVMVTRGENRMLPCLVTCKTKKFVALLTYQVSHLMPLAINVSWFHLAKGQQNVKAPGPLVYFESIYGMVILQYILSH